MARLEIRELDLFSATATFHWRADYAADVHRDRPFVDVSVPEIQEKIEKEAAIVWSTSESSLVLLQAVTEIAEKVFAESIDNHEWQMTSRGRKRFRDAPTWRTITDSGRLRDSLEISIEEGR